MRVSAPSGHSIGCGALGIEPGVTLTFIWLSPLSFRDGPRERALSDTGIQMQIPTLPLDSGFASFARAPE